MKTCKKQLHQYPKGLKYCPECKKAYESKWYIGNRDQVKRKVTEWSAKNPDQVRKKVTRWNTKNPNYRKHRYSTDPHYKLRQNLRNRLNSAIKDNLKTGSAVRDLGCSISELKAHLESKWQPGMSWENHGQYGWHIDHVVPLASFNLTDREQFLKACHFTNLQPLWAEDNLTKSDRHS